MYPIYPMSATYAKDIFTWKYPGEYALYNNEETKEALKKAPALQQTFNLIFGYLPLKVACF